MNKTVTLWPKGNVFQTLVGLELAPHWDSGISSGHHFVCDSFLANLAVTHQLYYGLS